MVPPIRWDFDNAQIDNPRWVLSQIGFQPHIAHKIRAPLDTDEGFVLRLLEEFRKRNLYPQENSIAGSATDFSWLHGDLRLRKDFMLRAMQILPGLEDSVPLHFWEDAEFAAAAAEVNPAACKYRGRHKDITLPQPQVKHVIQAFVCYSVRFFYQENAKAHTLQFLRLLAEHIYGYNPNDHNKGFCGSSLGLKHFLTNPAWPCRGNCLQLGRLNFWPGFCPWRQSCNDDTCWRRSFRQKLEKAKATNGFMLQVVETEPGERCFKLGAGQHIEALMAQSLGVKVLRLFLAEPTVTLLSGGGGGQLIEEVVAETLKKIEQLLIAQPGTVVQLASVPEEHMTFQGFSTDDELEIGAQSWWKRSWILGRRLFKSMQRDDSRYKLT